MMVLEIVRFFGDLGGASPTKFRTEIRDGDDNRVESRAQQITRIYSELEPCSSPGGYCASMIERDMSQAEIKYSFEYGDTPASRASGVGELQLRVPDASTQVGSPNRRAPAILLAIVLVACGEGGSHRLPHIEPQGTKNSEKERGNDPTRRALLRQVSYWGIEGEMTAAHLRGYGVSTFAILSAEWIAYDHTCGGDPRCINVGGVRRGRAKIEGLNLSVYDEYRGWFYVGKLNSSLTRIENGAHSHVRIDAPDYFELLLLHQGVSAESCAMAARMADAPPP